LTWKSAFRYRLFWILTALLAAAVVGLPLMLKDDGTAKGLVQILLTYTLSATATLLGFATLWLSCGTLAKDVEECQMQMVAVKPIARWQIWLGKWLGLLSL
jgi:ABC-type transport system involved in multi-copper enzyme maturation permease subunit